MVLLWELNLGIFLHLCSFTIVSKKSWIVYVSEGIKRIGFKKGKAEEQVSENSVVGNYNDIFLNFGSSVSPVMPGRKVNTLFLFLLEEFYKNNKAQKTPKNKNNLRTILSLELRSFK